MKNNKHLNPINKDIQNHINNLLSKKKADRLIENIIKATNEYENIINKINERPNIRKFLLNNKEKYIESAIISFLDEKAEYTIAYKAFYETLKETIINKLQEKIDSILPPYHSHKQKKLDFLKTADENNPSLYFGLELESIGKKENIFEIEEYRDLFSVEEDGSLSDGFELVSEPMTYKYLLKNKKRINKMLTALIKNGQSINDECGFHIHVSRKAFKGKEAINKAFMIINYYKEEMETFANRKEDSSYFEYFEIQENFMWQKDILISQRYDDSRYQAINLSNKETIEFRFFKGSLDSDFIFAGIELIKNIIQIVNLKKRDNCHLKELLKGQNITKYLNKNKLVFKDKTLSFNDPSYKDASHILKHIAKDISLDKTYDWAITLDSSKNRILALNTKDSSFLEIVNNNVIYHYSNGKNKKVLFRNKSNISLSNRELLELHIGKLEKTMRPFRD